MASLAPSNNRWALELASKEVRNDVKVIFKAIRNTDN